MEIKTVELGKGINDIETMKGFIEMLEHVVPNSEPWRIYMIADALIGIMADLSGLSYNVILRRLKDVNDKVKHK